jgi:hypothetical protein
MEATLPEPDMLRRLFRAFADCPCPVAKDQPGNTSSSSSGVRAADPCSSDHATTALPAPDTLRQLFRAFAASPEPVANEQPVPRLPPAFVLRQLFKAFQQQPAVPVAATSVSAAVSNTQPMPVRAMAALPCFGKVLLSAVTEDFAAVWTRALAANVGLYTEHRATGNRGEPLDIDDFHTRQWQLSWGRAGIAPCQMGMSCRALLVAGAPRQPLPCYLSRSERLAYQEWLASPVETRTPMFEHASSLCLLCWSWGLTLATLMEVQNALPDANTGQHLRRARYTFVVVVGPKGYRPEFCFEVLGSYNSTAHPQNVSLGIVQFIPSILRTGSVTTVAGGVRLFVDEIEMLSLFRSAH